MVPHTRGVTAVSSRTRRIATISLDVKYLDIKINFVEKLVIKRMDNVTDDIDRILGQWARERPDLDTAAMGVFGRIFRLSKLAGDVAERAYSRFGIGRPEFDVLAALRRSGEPFQLSPGALAASMMLSTGGTTARLDRLEKAGLVTRSPDPNDRRAILVRLTERGRALADEAVTAGLAEQQRLLAHLPPEKSAQLSALLRELLHGL
ncbi:MarR family transcriptional regulator [Actinoplanes lobatus]|uniref:MarR family transcriptional regulator n=1 Tax=Actinoplanes lobatus TaxID=113568 RepID=A0ABQ4AK56_9ACTN|nr:MarR family transcriptional regulator [Actinoplanes lobatus]GIE41382.1 MarR family transcriptional regulator [Actinoplanes lobatus]